MQSLLRWSIENSTNQVALNDGGPPSERKTLDPGIIDVILGKPDSVQMKEDVAIAVDTAKNEDERIDALEHLEMVSKIDKYSVSEVEDPSSSSSKILIMQMA